MFADDPAIRFLESRVKSDPADFTAHNLLAAHYLQRLRLTGRDENLTLAAREARDSLAAMPAEQNFGGLIERTLVEQASHQFAAARESVRRLVQLLPGKSMPFQLLGDALLELGDYKQAAAAYAEMRRLDADSVETETRLARLAFVRGNVETARQHLTTALTLARDLSPPAAEPVAWCSVQLGQLCFGVGDWDTALKHYQAALEAWPDSYAALEHLAELRAAQQHYDEALSLYQKLVARVPRPEFHQAIGDLYAFMGKPAEARPWHERALAAYLESVERGNVHFYHHLVDFYCDSQENPTEALKWARKDLELRHSVFAYDALAWALYRNGEFAQAREAMNKALALGTKDAHLLYHAAKIHSAAGDPHKAEMFLERAALVNPRFNSFHVHR